MCSTCIVSYALVTSQLLANPSPYLNLFKNIFRLHCTYYGVGSNKHRNATYRRGFCCFWNIFARRWNTARRYVDVESFRYVYLIDSTLNFIS